MSNIPPQPHATVDTKLAAPQALQLAEEAIANPIPLMSAFGVSKIAGEITGRHPTGFTYKTSIIPFMKMKMNDGYVVAQDDGQGGTRVSFHENKRSTMIFGIMLGVIVAFEILIYFTLVRQGAPTVMGYGYGGMSYQAAPPSSGFPLWLFILLFVLIVGVTAFQMYEVVTSPKKVVQNFAMRANGGMPVAQPGFAGQPAGGFPPHPQAGGFPPQAGAGFPPQPQPQPQPQPGGFPPQPQAQAGGFPPPPMPAAPVAAPAAAPPPIADADDQLRQLAELRDSGVITAADYDQAAAAIAAKR